MEEEHRNLELLSENLEAAKKEQEEKIGQLKRKNKELGNKFIKKTSESEKILVREQKLKKKVEDCVKKSRAETETKNVELESMSVENKRLSEESNAVRLKNDKLTQKVKRLKLRLKEMPERKCFVQLLH